MSFFSFVFSNAFIAFILDLRGVGIAFDCFDFLENRKE